MDTLTFPYGFSTEILTLALSSVQANKLTKEITPAPVEVSKCTGGGAFSFADLRRSAWPNYKGYSINEKLAEYNLERKTKVWESITAEELEYQDTVKN